MARGAVSTDAQTRSCSGRKIAFEPSRQMRQPWLLRCNDRIPSHVCLRRAESSRMKNFCPSYAFGKKTHPPTCQYPTLI